MAIVPLTAACLWMAANAYGIPVDVLKGLHAAENGAVGHVTPNRDKAGRIASVDIGPFQVNSTWLESLTALWRRPTSKVTYELLRDNGCANALAAAWIFRGNLNDSGGNIGVAVGLYNAPHNPAAAERYRRHFIDTFRNMREEN